SCAFWIATGWPDGASAPLFGAVVGSFLAATDDPLPAYRDTFKVVVIGTAINAIYLFAVLPRITTLEALIVALMPVFVLVSWLTARPATARFGYLLSIFVPVQLALDSSYAANFASFANSSIALMFGVAITGAVSAIARFSGAGWIANRLLRSDWRTLAS